MTDLIRGTGHMARGLTIAAIAIAVLMLGPRAEVTAADMTFDGGVIALRGYEQVWMWVRDQPDLSQTFDVEPCSAPSPDEVQGEALAFAPDGDAYFTVSEGTGANVNYVGPIEP